MRAPLSSILATCAIVATSSCSRTSPNAPPAAETGASAPPVAKSLAPPDGEASRLAREFRGLVDGFNAETGARPISIREARRRLAAGEATLFVDVREPDEQAVSTLPGALSLRPADVARSAAKLRSVPRGTAIVTYCTAGYRSGLAAVELEKLLEREVLNLDGGIIAWFNAGGEVAGADGRARDRIHPFGPDWARFVRPRQPAPEPAPEPAAAPAAPVPAPDDGAEGKDRGAAKPSAKAPLVFRELWAYLYPGEESRWASEARITDVCLFNFRLDSLGKIEGKLSEPALASVRRRDARAHVVLASSGQASLLHFLLEPGSRERERFLTDTAGLASRHGADGFQLDLEGLLAEDRERLASFIADLRGRLPKPMIFSLALPALTAVGRGAYRYRDLAALADRFVIMVYDEHWQGGPPGSVSSRPWHDKVLAHALAELPAAKIVAGLPLYGRIWQVDPAARALRHRDLTEILARPGVEVVRDADASHRFLFRQEVRLEGWFEDAESLRAKLASALGLGVERAGFWRLGQEDPRLWSVVAAAQPVR